MAEGQPGAQWKHTAPRDSCVWDPAVTQLKELSKPRDLVPYQNRKEHQWEILKQIWEEAKEEHGRSVCGEDEPRAPADLEREEYKSQLSFCHNTKLMWLQFLMEASQQEEKQSNQATCAHQNKEKALMVLSCVLWMSGYGHVYVAVMLASGNGVLQGREPTAAQSQEETTPEKKEWSKSVLYNITVHFTLFSVLFYVPGASRHTSYANSYDVYDDKFFKRNLVQLEKYMHFFVIYSNILFHSYAPVYSLSGTTWWRSNLQNCCDSRGVP